MKLDDLHNKLKNILSNSDGKFRILEEQIDINLQVDFYQMLDKISKSKREDKVILEDAGNINDKSLTIDEKKMIIAELSILENVEAYRIIQELKNKKLEGLDSWLILAMQHSRLSLESSFLEEQKIFISTGLGGKSDKLRYFFACKTKSNLDIKKEQEKIIFSEFEFALKMASSEIEQFFSFSKYVACTCLIPFDFSANDLIIKVIEELNNYGVNLDNSFLLTNVKELDEDEIIYFFNKKAKRK